MRYLRLMPEKSLVLLPKRRSLVVERTPASGGKVLCFGKTEARFCGKAVVLPDQLPHVRRSSPIRGRFTSHLWDVNLPLVGINSDYGSETAVSGARRLLPSL